MSEAMLKKYCGNRLGEQPRSDSRSETTLYAEEIIERVTQKMNYNVQIHGNNIDFSNRIADDACY